MASDLRGTLMVDMGPFIVVVGLFSVFYFFIPAMNGLEKTKPHNWGLITGVYVLIVTAFTLGLVLSAAVTGVWGLYPLMIVLGSLAVLFLFVLFMILAHRSGRRVASKGQTR